MKTKSPRLTPGHARQQGRGGTKDGTRHISTPWHFHYIGQAPFPAGDRWHTRSLKRRSVRCPHQGDTAAKLTDSDREKIAKLYREGLDQRALAKLSGVTAGTICNSLKKMGVKARRSGRRFFHIDGDRPPDDRIRTLYLEGKSLRAIGELFQMSPDSVMNSLERTGTPTRKKKGSPKKAAAGRVRDRSGDPGPEALRREESDRRARPVRGTPKPKRGQPKKTYRRNESLALRIFRAIETETETPLDRDSPQEGVEDEYPEFGDRREPGPDKDGPSKWQGSQSEQYQGERLRHGVRKVVNRKLHEEALSDVGEVSAFKDGLTVVTDTVEVLTRVSEMLDQVEATDAVTWVVQLHVVQLTGRDTKDLGMDVVPALEVAATLGDASSGKLLSLETDLTASLKSVLQFANEKGRGGIVAEPLFLLVDGEESTVDRTRKVPYESSTISPQSGTIVKSYTFQQVGLIFKVKLRELNWDSARATIFVSIGDIETQGTDGRPPTTRQQEMTVSADMKAGGVYLVGALWDGSSEDTQQGGLKIGGKTRGEVGQTLVFARVARIGSPLSGAEAGAPAGVPAPSWMAGDTGAKDKSGAVHSPIRSEESELVPLVP